MSETTPPPSPKSPLTLDLEKLNACIHCGMCLPACPTYRVTGSEAESPRGRLYLMKKALAGELSVPDIQPHLDQCLACHGCETVCPSGVQYGSLLMETRAHWKSTPFRGISGWLKRLIFAHVLPRHNLLLGLGGLLRVYQRSGLQAGLRRLGWLQTFPALAHQEQLLPAVPPHRALHGGLSFGNPSGEHIALWVGCVMDVFYNPVHWDTLTVLAANGYHITIPPPHCCGALAHHAGDVDITRTLARQNIDRLLPSNPRWIVVNSAGCGSSMKDYGQLLADDPQYAKKAADFAARTVDILELLAQKPLAKFKQAVPLTVTYHAACHLHHVQRIQEQPLQLLAQIPGLTLVPLTDMSACCGSAGIYNLEHPELSQDILRQKMAHIQNAHIHGAQAVLTGNPGCLLQLQKGLNDAQLPMAVRHPISLLADAYRPPVSDKGP